jgi:UMF1 family MFS transporter
MADAETFAPAGGVSFLSRLGLDRPVLRAWAMYDWANSVFMTIVILIFPIYFADVASKGLPAAEASRRFAFATTISMTLVALLSPFLGAAADYAAAKKKFLAGFLVLGVVTTAGMAMVGEGDWLLGATLFILANIGVTSSIVFYESLLPHICGEREVDRVSSAGYAMGYVGGGLSMAVSVLAIVKPAWLGLSDANVAIRISFLFAAVWWAVFSIPLFRRVPEPPALRAAPEHPGRGQVKISV